MIRTAAGFILLATMTFTLGCCSPLYVPTVPPTVMPRKQGDLRVALSGGTHGFDGNIGIAADDNMVLVAAGSFEGGGEEFDYSRHAYGELMAGWYTTFGVGSAALFFGGGTGRAEGIDAASGANALFALELWINGCGSAVRDVVCDCKQGADSVAGFSFVAGGFSSAGVKEEFFLQGHRSFYHKDTKGTKEHKEERGWRHFAPRSSHFAPRSSHFAHLTWHTH